MFADVISIDDNTLAQKFFLRILLSHDTDIIFVSDTLKQDYDKFWLQIRCVHI